MMTNQDQSRSCLLPAAIASIFLLASLVFGEVGYDNSPDFWLDARATPSGNIIGRVVDSGLTPIEAAAVVIRPTNATTLSQADGSFALDATEVDEGYQLQVIASGYEVETRSGLAVVEGNNDLGDIVMTPLTGTHMLSPLPSDINPIVSEVEEGGTAYRYYLVRDASTSQQKGGVSVAVREAGGGSPVDQSEDRQHPGWAGAVLGVSDAGSGIVRLAIPASAVGSGLPGESAQFEAEASPGYMMTFQMNVTERAYEHTWGQETAGGVGGLVNIAGGEVRVSAEGGHGISVVRSYGGLQETERIESGNSLRLQAGIGAGTPVGGAAKIGSFAAGATAGAEAGVYTELVHGFAYGFDPYDQTAYSSALRIYCLYASSLDTAPSIGPLISFVRTSVEPLFLDDIWLWSEAGAELGLYGQFDAMVGMSAGEDIAVGGSLQAEGASETGLRVLARSHRIDEFTEFEAGLVTEMSGSLDAMLGVQVADDNPLSTVLGDVGATASASAAFGMEQLVTLAVPRGAAHPSLIRLTTRSGGSYSAYAELGNWTGGVVPDEEETLIETVVEQTVLSQSEWEHAASLSSFLDMFLAEGQAQVGNSYTDDLSAALFSDRTFNEDLRYYQAVELSTRDEHQTGLSGTIVLGLDLELKLDFLKGRRYVLQEGVVRGGKLYPLQVAGTVDGVPLNSQTIIDLQETWAMQASGILAEAWDRVTETIQDGVGTRIQAMTSLGEAHLQIASGTWAPGIEITADSWNASGETAESALLKGPTIETESTTNLVQGVGGVYRFSAPEPPSQPLSLTMSYQDDEVIGLDEAELQIYRFDEATGFWTLVGGSVDITANTVSAQISTLGVFAISPPLPSGEMGFQLSSPSVPADGVSTVTATAQGVLLNNGQPTGDGWMFDVTASGMTIASTDEDPVRDGVQVASIGSELAIVFRAPSTGGTGSFTATSVYGDAQGDGYVAFEDSVPPQQVSGLTVEPGQTRLYLSWNAAAIADYAAGYRVYYRQGAAGPPWDGQASVDGRNSPISVPTNRATLRGLTLGSDYFVAVSAFDDSNNEGPLSATVSATTAESSPAPPLDLRSEEEATGQYIVSWTPSADDGFNDRDVDHYVVSRHVGVDGVWEQAGEAPAGQSLYTDVVPGLSAGTPVAYIVTAVDTAGLVSSILSESYAAADFNKDGDVDVDDLDTFETCASGPGVPGTESSICQRCDLDGDDDVDQADFGAFQHCFSGAGVPVDPSCATE